MNKDNVAEKWSEQIDLCLQSENPREQIDRYIKSLLTSHRLSLKEELLKKLPKECEFDCKEIINQVLKEK